ncbi:MAG: hypothetical protein M3Y69_02555 [Verrucomicrobiota bacterium]|nr:hypothetical protein [Verrucomicrobiota bacterium]
MELLPQEKPSPRLLYTVVPDSYGAASATAGPTSRSALLKGALLSGNGLAIFIGLIIACAVVAGAWWLHDRNARHAAVVAPTDNSPIEEVASPTPVMVQMRADQIRVTAISLGQPRLAVINDQQVGEGEFVTVHVPTSGIEIKLQVIKIEDGRVELSDGRQVIVTLLSASGPQVKKP